MELHRGNRKWKSQETVISFFQLREAKITPDFEDIEAGIHCV